MASMNISLPDEMKTWVEENIQTGHSNASNYVLDLIRSDHDRLQELRAALIEG